MKTNRILTLFPIMAVILSLDASAISIENVTAKQRYPWNGKVDITCTVSGIDGGAIGALSVSTVNRDLDETNSVSHVRIVRDGAESDDLTISANGDYRLVWDAAADLGEVLFTNMVVSVEAVVVTDRGKIQLWEGGPYWAEANIGAENPWDYGLYFWWGDTVGYKRENGTWTWIASDGSSQNFSFSFDITPTCGKDNTALQSEGWITAEGVLAPAHDAAQAHWGGSWRMPTKAEYDALLDNCDWTWTTTNGVSGYVVRGCGDFAAASIFLPAAGLGHGSSLNFAGSNGFCWSSVPDASDSDSTWELAFGSGYRHTSRYYRYDGQSVRPVQGFAE